jgi:hypothetical protein
MLSGKPDAGKPLVRFDEGRDFGPAYSTKRMLESAAFLRGILSAIWATWARLGWWSLTGRSGDNAILLIQ